MDSIDLTILETLQENARITNQELSERVGLSPSPCLQRLRKLENSGTIEGYLGRVAIEQIARTVTIIANISLASHDPADFASFEAAVAASPDIVECLQVSGSFDYQLRFVCADMASYMRASDALIGDGHADMKITSSVVMRVTKPFRGFPLRRLTAETP